MINQDITKFCGLFAQVASVPKSKWMDDKYIEETLEIFKLEGKGKRLGKECICDGCWRILKESLKWKVGWVVSIMFGTENIEACSFEV